MSAKMASTGMCVAVAVLAVLSGSAGLAVAAKLDEPACSALKAERARLATDAIKSDMAKGPQWGKDNLSSGRLKEIEQLIGIEENIAFRCPLPKPPPVQANVAKAPPDGVSAVNEKEAGAAEKPASGKPPAKKPDAKAASAKKKSASETAKAAAKNSGASDDQLAPTKPAAKQKSKPKTSDAYSPPPKSSTLGSAGDALPSPAGNPANAAVVPLSP